MLSCGHPKRALEPTVMEGANISRYADTALQYGPFFFAILFSMIVPPYALRELRRSKAIGRGATQARVLHENALWFRASWILGALLVIASVVWWIYVRMNEIDRSERAHYYQGVVSGLTPDDRIELTNSKDDIYFNYVTLPQMLGECRFVLVTQAMLTTPLDMSVQYVNKRMGVGSSGDIHAALILMHIDPSKTQYIFTKDENRGLLIVPKEIVLLR
jgi:hypothetical protein